MEAGELRGHPPAPPPPLAFAGAWTRGGPIRQTVVVGLAAAPDVTPATG